MIKEGQIWILGQYKMTIIKITENAICWDGIYSKGYWSNKQEFEQNLVDEGWKLL